MFHRTGIVTVIVFLLLLAAPAARADGGRDFYRRLEGDIGGNLGIVMHLTQDGDNVSGWYYYLSRRETLFLKGKASADDGSLTLFEFPRGVDRGNDKARTGEFHGAWEWKDAGKTVQLRGTWRSPDGKKRFPFSLRESYGGDSVALTPVSLACAQSTNAAVDDPPRAEADLRLLYPQSFPDRNVLARLRKTYADPYPDDPGRALQRVCDRFFTEHRAAAAEADDDLSSPMYQWSLSQTRSVILNDRGFLCQDMAVYTFTGGAHGNYADDFKISDLATGKEITAADILAPPARPRLADLVKNKARELLRQRIRESQGSEPDADQMEGAFLEDDFKLTNNVYIAIDGLGFYYNIYEITPYVLGPVDVFLTWAEVKAYLRPDSPLQRLVK